MKKLNDIFETLIQHFKKEDTRDESTHTETVDSQDSTEPRLSRSGRSSKRPSKGQGPFRRFWRKYHLTKIILILGLGFGLVTGGYLFYVAKSTNVNDLQNALKATTLIYDKDGQEAGSLTGQKGTYVELD